MCELKMVQMLFVHFSPQICQFQLVMDTHLPNHEPKRVEVFLFLVKCTTGSTFQKDICEHTPSYLGLGCDLWGEN